MLVFRCMKLQEAWSLILVEERYSRPLKPGSAGELGTGIRYLARWMNQRNFLSFSELDNAASEVFLDDVADETALADLQPSNTEETIPRNEDDSTPVADGEGMSVSQVFRRVIYGCNSGVKRARCGRPASRPCPSRPSTAGAPKKSRAISLRVPLPLFRRCRMRSRFPS